MIKISELDSQDCSEVFNNKSNKVQYKKIIEA